MDYTMRPSYLLGTVRHPGLPIDVRFRVGITDITAAVVVGVVLFLPARSSAGVAAYDDSQCRKIESAQAAVAAEPADGEAVELLAERLVAAGQLDWALRVAGAGAVHRESPSNWRALLAVSSVHAERIEIIEAHEWAKQAIGACEAEGSNCPKHELVRLEVYEKALTAGVEAIQAGIDPSTDPFEFRKAIDLASPRARLRGKR
jgi:hypothetical protein